MLLCIVECLRIILFIRSKSSFLLPNTHPQLYLGCWYLIIISISFSFMVKPQIPLNLGSHNWMFFCEYSLNWSGLLVRDRLINPLFLICNNKTVIFDFDFNKKIKNYIINSISYKNFGTFLI